MVREGGHAMSERVPWLWLGVAAVVAAGILRGTLVRSVL